MDFKIRNSPFIFSSEILHNSLLLKNNSFITFYSLLDKIPNLSLTTVYWEDVKKKMKRRNIFHQDSRIPKGFRATNRDYKKTGYDRGHLIPNAFKDYSTKAQEETFLLTNIAPQEPKLNRWVWRTLENKVILMCKFYDRIDLIVGVIHGDRKIGKNVTVPDFFFMVVYISKFKKVRVYLIPNNKSVNKTKLLRGKYRINLRVLNSLLKYKITLM